MRARKLFQLRAAGGDQVTQQNAALVEESAAAASSLKSQAEQLVHAVSVFKIAGATPAAAAPSTPYRARPALRPAGRTPASVRALSLHA